MTGLGGRETLLRLRQGYHITMESGSDSLEVMIVPRCDTCRWWNSLVGAKSGDCGLVDQPRAKFEPYSDSPAGLETRANFGCVQWEGKSDD